MWIGDGAGQGLHFSNFSKHGLVRNVLGTVLEKVKPRKKPYQEYVDFWWSWQGSSFFKLFQTWSGKGWSLGPFRKRGSQEKNLIRSMLICDGLGKGHHFSIFFPTWSGKECLGDHFGKSEAKRKALSGICGFVMVLARIIIFPIVPNMVWEGIVLGTILEKVRPRETPNQEYVDL